MPTPGKPSVLDRLTHITMSFVDLTCPECGCERFRVKESCFTCIHCGKTYTQGEINEIHDMKTGEAK